MNKVDLSKINECTLVKIRNYGLCVLLERIDCKPSFYNKEKLINCDLSKTGGVCGVQPLFKSGYGKEYEIVAYKQYTDQITVVKSVFMGLEPVWDWEENEKRYELINLIDKLKQQLSEVETELSKIK